MFILHCDKCSSGCSGPGYKSPKAAILEGPREKLMYVVCVHTDSNKSDVLCTVDIDPTSDDYCKIIHKLRMPYVGDELHHSGWNICSSCHGQSQKRNTLVLPCLMSDRVYFIDTTNERAPSMKKVLNSTEINQYGVSTLHTSHCSPNREILISTLGKPNGDAMGEFLCIDAETLKVKGTWSTGTKRAMFGYDFWYQPYHDVLVATEWGVPRIFKRGYAITDSYDPAIYGRSLNFYSWNKRELKQVLNLGEDGIAPLEIRFLHDPKASEGFVGCAVTSNVYKFYKTSNAEWIAKKVIQIPPKQVEGWIAPQMSGRRLYGSPQMLQLSLDGTRLYVTTSIFKPWDQQFYPEHVKYGSTMIKLDVDVINGGLKLDEEFLVDFGKEKNDILLAHEMRYPGGDCTSDIWLSVD
ncbi:PREDICTED: selenium-binding protein 1-B isoform X5 [Eufriesea mexicana]|uniref:selenium-binding protein 1-B isoform X5 n=1 Tax=Eufriesea mexicana TaxID=516756 RepID=UPI00083C220C|nr:PREDICTED: selenium-binding protein 1-B isoform X5 [Eufriesea mexicana]